MDKLKLFHSGIGVIWLYGFVGGVKEARESAFLWTLYFVKNLKPPTVSVKIAATGRVNQGWIIFSQAIDTIFLD